MISLVHQAQQIEADFLFTLLSCLLPNHPERPASIGVMVCSKA